MPEPPEEPILKPGDQRKLAAVMFTDIVGYSRMMHKDEAATLRFLALHNALLEDQVKAFGGRVIKTIGDSLMVDFGSVVDAVNCAVAIQTRLHERNKGLKPPEQHFIRIGIHLGDVVVTEGDIFGEGVNIAARLEPLSPYGGICVSREVVAHLKGLRNVKVIRRGPQSLKNISQPVEIFQLWAPGMDPTAGQRVQWARYQGRLWALGAVAALLALMLCALPWWNQWSDFRGWESYMSEDFRDLAGFSQRWQSDAQSLSEAGLEGGWMSLKKPLSIQAFRIKVTYRSKPGNPADLTLAALTTGEEGNGLFYRHSADPRLNWVKDQVGNRRDEGVRDEALRAGEKAEGDGRRWLMLTYDGGKLTAQSGADGLWNRLFPGGPTLQTWVRQAPSSGFFRFGVKGRGVRLDRVDIYFKKPAGEKDVRARADIAALNGQTDTALELFHELLKLSAEPPEQCEFLYRQALIHRSTGEAKEAVNLYQRILSSYPENLTSGYARLDLGLMEMDLAAKAHGKKDRLRHAEQARGYFTGLLKRQKNHPEAVHATYLMALNALEQRDRDKAAQGALSILRSGGPYAEQALEILLKALKGTGKKDDPDWPGKCLADLEPLFQKGKLKGPLREKAAAAKAGALRLLGKTAELEELVAQACQPGAYSLTGREAVVNQWIAAEGAGLPPEESQALADRLDKKREVGLAFDRAYLRDEGTRLADRAQATLWKAVRLETQKGGPKDPRRREFMDWAQGKFKITGGAGGAKVLPREDGGVRLDFRSGQDIDQYLTIGPGVGPFSVEGSEDSPGKAVDARIYRRLSFKVKMTKRKRISLCLAEWGVTDPDTVYSSGPGGADGEQYKMGSWTGTGQWQRYEINLKDAKPDLDWGNQEGDLKLDLGAIGAVVLVVPTGQGNGELEFKDLVFER
jgi:class 3 adenylate cyclase/tetratricopeptide (TPR) repeat protein